jgi:Tol biopolymer transport system component
MDVTTRALAIEDILALERFDGIFTPAVDLSPCKSQLAAAVIRGCANREHTAIPFLVGMDLGRLHLIDLESGDIRVVPEPSGAGLSCPLWSPDGRHIAVVVASVEGVRVGVVDVQSLEVRLYGEHHGGVRNFVFGHNMSKRCMYANQKETRVTEATENPKRAA